MKSRMLAAWFCVVMPLLAYAASLDSSTDLDSHPPIPLEGGTQNVSTNASGTYDFDDKNGDGSAGDTVSPAGLNLGNYNLYSDKENSSNIKLDLNGGDLVSTNGDINTSNRRDTGDIIIYNVGIVRMRDGFLYTGWTGGGYGGTFDKNGDILIGQNGVAGPRATSVQVNSVQTLTSWYHTAGDIIIHCSGDVLIQNASGVAANVDTSAGFSNVNELNGDIEIRHDGTFVAEDIKAMVRQGIAGGGDIVIDGDTLDDGVSGPFTANLIDTHDLVLSWGAYSGDTADISISNYTSATISSLDSRMLCGPGDAGSVIVSGIDQNINITGSITLDGSSASYDGDLTLSAGGIITLASLDLDLVGTATFHAGTYTLITGALSNFNKADPGSSGLVESGGGIIYYRSDNNPDLLTGGTNGRYTLSNGTLVPMYPVGTVFRVR